MTGAAMLTRLLTFSLVFAGFTSAAQVATNYSFSASSGTYTAISLSSYVPYVVKKY